MNDARVAVNVRLKVNGISSKHRRTYRNLRRHLGFDPQSATLIVWGMIRQQQAMADANPGQAVIEIDRRPSAERGEA